MSDQAKQEAVDGLLREGSASYLDALYALDRFRLIVTEQAAAVLGGRLPAFVSIVGIGEPESNIPQPYCNPDGFAKDYDGNWAWVTARVFFREPWSGHCHLGLSFDRHELGNNCTPYVTFMCTGGRAVFAKLAPAFRSCDHAGYYYADEREKECGFSLKLQNPLTMGTEFEQMMDYVIKVWTQIGRWDQLPK